MKLLLFLLFPILSFAQARTSSSHHVERYEHTCDGVNDYYSGINGTNGFVITAFQGVTNVVINVLMEFPSSIEAADAVTRLFEISNSGRTSLVGPSFGNATGLFADEYITSFSSIAGLIRGAGVTDGGGSISAGWHMITVVNNTGVRIYVDGVPKATYTAFPSGDGAVFTNGWTPDRLALFATTVGGVPQGASWREYAIIGTTFNDTDILNLYNFYTVQGNITVENSRRSITKFIKYVPLLIEVWRGNVSGSDLLGTKNAAHDLTLTNF